MEAEIESLLKSLKNLKDDASDESRKTLIVLEKQRRERAEAFTPSAQRCVLKRSRSKPRETGIATRDYAQEHLFDDSGCGCRCIGAAGGLFSNT